MPEITGETKITYTAKELFDRLETRLDKRLDKQDALLEGIDRRLDTTATKDDLRAVREETATGLSEVHKRIDKVVEAFDSRVSPLEADGAAERAVEQSRSRFRTNLAWLAGIIGTLAIVASVTVPFLLH